ncbi:MAG: class I SAM-dependent methyltransferase, partial [Sphingobacteriia bacterium]
MLEKAREKISTDHVHFVQADLTNDWTFTNGQVFDLAVFSLVLEHIEDLDTIFQKLAGCVAKGGHVYTGELHPFKQYAGSKARFENPDGS